MPTRTLRPVKDAYVAADTPGTNHGAEAVLKVESKVLPWDSDKRLLCAFDLRDLPTRATRVVEAKLRLVPTRQAAGRVLRCHEVTGAWTEQEVTWDNQPAIGADHGTRSSDDGLQEWDVTASAQARFPAGLLSLRVKDDAEGSLAAQLQEYASREGAGTPPELVVTYEDQATAALACTVTPRQRAARATLDAQVRVRRNAARFQQFRSAALLGADGGPTKPVGVAYDAGRDALWVADQAARRVRRYARASLALEREYEVPAGFQPLGCAYDGQHLWLSDDLSDPMTIRKFRIDEATLTQVASYAHDYRAALAWDGAALWSSDPAGGVVVRHRPDASLSVAERFQDLPDVLGLAFPGDRDEVVTLEHAGGGMRIRRRSKADLALLEDAPYRGGGVAWAWGLALVPGVASGRLVNAEEATGALLARPSLDLASTVRPGRIPGAAALAASVRPGRIPGSASLESRVRANMPGVAVVRSVVTPRVAATRGFASRVRPRERELVVRGRLRGIVATPVVVEAQDFLDISVEVGSSITHTSRGERRALRRVVQLLDARETLSFPREATSELGRGSTQDQLRRGDAVLYAAGCDRFRPGDLVTWQGLTWVVVGMLAWEMVGDVKLYQEVGLRRLGVATRARVEGTVGEAP